MICCIVLLSCQNKGCKKDARKMLEKKEASPTGNSKTQPSSSSSRSSSSSSSLPKTTPMKKNTSGVRGNAANSVGGVPKMSQRRLPPSSSHFPHQPGEERPSAGGLTPKPFNSSEGTAIVGGRDGGREGGYAMLSRSNLMLMEIPEGNEALVSPSGESMSSLGGAGNRGILWSNRSMSFGGGTGGFNTGRSIGSRSIVSVSELSEASQMSVVEALQIEDLGKKGVVPSLDL